MDVIKSGEKSLNPFVSQVNYYVKEANVVKNALDSLNPFVSQVNYYIIGLLASVGFACRVSIPS